MQKRITFNELRELKDALPDGSMQRIAEQMNMSADTVRNFFGGMNFREGECVGFHIEPGPDGGCVVLDDDSIYLKAWEILRSEADYSDHME